MRPIQIFSVLILLGGLETAGFLHPPFLAHAAERHDHDDHAPARDSSPRDQNRNEHGDHTAHDEHGHDDEGGAIHLSPDVIREFGIEVQVAHTGTITQTVRLPGEVVYNADRIAHVRPTVAGSVKQVNVSVGDGVETGQTMAVLNSRELAAARSEYLAAVARLDLARDNLERERQLFAEKAGTERGILVAQQAYREADIARLQAENALHALGYSRAQVAQVTQLDDAAFNTYEMLAPLTGIVTRRHITIGEIIGLEDDDAPFVVADLSSVWVNLTVYQHDLAQVRAGQAVTVEFGGDIPDTQGRIAFISPALDETTRTATARVVLDDPHPDWRPGLFVSGIVETGQTAASVVVPYSAVTELDDETVIFVQSDEGFEPREVRLGRVTPQAVEIVGGLFEGERYVADNVLALKAEMNRAALEHAGHAH